MKYVLPIILVGALIAGAPSIASAHTALSSSNIQAGSVLTDVPDELQLDFGKSVGLAKVEILTSDDKLVEEITPARSMTKRHIIEMPVLADGHYKIRWRAIAGDGHVMKGEIAFSVA